MFSYERTKISKKESFTLIRQYVTFKMLIALERVHVQLHVHKGQLT